MPGSLTRSCLIGQSNPVPPNDTKLEARLLEAHASDDRLALIGLYAQAAEIAPDADGRGFYLTHAYVFALERGDPRASELKQQLIALGRERA